MATYVQPKHLTVFTYMIKACIGCNHTSFLYVLILEHNEGVPSKKERKKKERKKDGMVLS
jgi:hypothetical protein